VTITAIPGNTSSFDAWRGACSGYPATQSCIDGFFVDVENAANSNLLLAHVPITWQTTGCPSVPA
jgi:hypothetical protein